ncbi:hypothetical protein NDU88_002520 [Pleurodeles waltl]|uniref:Uncharacterized protein n=1 Tax=Pleurodeles waltl TaxID=8319 RepID=A0AAV7WLG9_PLEWA|nr:hypothetical protein NDU88_002520 [Pleurodeles waltl]
MPFSGPARPHHEEAGAARSPKPRASPSAALCRPRSRATAPPRCSGFSAMSAGPMGTPLRLQPLIPE